MTTSTSTSSSIDPCDEILGSFPNVATSPLPEANVRTFVTAGKAVFTLVSPKTGKRFTYKVTARQVEAGKVLHFVSVLTGSDNDSDFTFLGTIFDGRTYRHGSRSRIGTAAPSAVAFGWFWGRLTAGKDLCGTGVYHEGRCGRCGRTLTVPSSIESGFGPECSDKMGR